MNMRNTVKDLLKSKKALVSLVAAAVWLGGKFGLHLDNEALLGAVTPLWMFVLGQGIADHGKEAAKDQLCDIDPERVTELLAIIGGGTTALSLVAILLLMRWGMSSKDGEMGAVQAGAAEQVAHGETKVLLERGDFEAEKLHQALDAMTKRAEKLAEELGNAIARKSLGDGLASNDVDGRLSRIALREAEAAGDSVSASLTAGTVSDGTPRAAGGTETTDVHALDPIDVLK